MQYIFSLCVYLLDDDTDDTETDDDTDQGDDEETSFSEQPGYALHEPCNTPMEYVSLCSSITKYGNFLLVTPMSMLRTS